MTTRDYPRLGPVEFARQLIQTGDLDPIYVALNQSGFGREQKLRWLCAYIAFYHAGVACWMSEQEGPIFWHWMMAAAKNEGGCPVEGRWPRSSERRHFRGQQAVAAIDHWARYGRKQGNELTGPETMFSYIAGCDPGGDTLARTMDRAREYRSIGGWSSLKCADIADACLGASLVIEDIGPLMYDTPRKGMAIIADMLGFSGPETERQQQVFDCFKTEMSDLQIPHKPGVPLGPLEWETQFCKFKSHLQGHYPIGKDIAEIRHGIEPWAKVCESAEQFRLALPDGMGIL